MRKLLNWACFLLGFSVALATVSAEAQTLDCATSSLPGTAVGGCDIDNPAGFSSLAEVSAYWDSYLVASCPDEVTWAGGWGWHDSTPFQGWARELERIDCSPNLGHGGNWTSSSGGWVGAQVYGGSGSCTEEEDWEMGGECGEPFPSCPFVAGETFHKTGSGTPPATRCDSNCALSKNFGISMDGGYYAQYEVTGDCGDDDPVDDSETGLNCLQTDGGVQYCADTNASENCGTVNGEYICLGSVPEGNCLFTPEGAAICDGDSQTDTPDETIVDDETAQEYDVYADGDTGGPSGDPGGPTPGTGTGTGGTTGGGGGGGGDGEGECEGSSCTGDLPGENEAVDGFGDLFGAFYARVAASNLVSAFSGIAGSMPAGSCSGVSSEPIAYLDGATLTLDVHCDLWPELAAIIYPIMLAAWSLLGGIILLRA